MNRVADGFSPVIAVDRKVRKPLHRQIYDGYRGLIVGRSLGAGQQIPSTRALAVELGISRIPVLNAYAQLLAEGYFETRAGAGTFVSSSLPEQLTSVEYQGDEQREARSGPRPASQRKSMLPRYLRDKGWMRGFGAFSPGQLAFDQFPFRTWSNLVARHCRGLDFRSLNYGDPMGSKEFRETIATYLRTARAVRCDPQQIMVVSGSQQALEISVRALFDPGSRVWIEEPGYVFLRCTLVAAGCHLIPVPVDGDGLNVSKGIRRCPQARAAFVTPSHQFPLGVTMSASRRLQLLEWAQTSGAWIIEDDYDSEYRYEAMPIASLQGLDRHSRVIYIGTFSKTLFPSLRLGYIVVPPDLVDRFTAVRFAIDFFPPHLYQAVLTDFISEGHFSRHIRKTRLLYRERRSALVEAIRSELDIDCEIGGAEAGMHLILSLPQDMRDEEISQRAAAEKLWLWPLSTCYVGKPLQHGFILGFAGTKASEMRQAVRRMRNILQAQHSARRQKWS